MIQPKQEMQNTPAPTATPEATPEPTVTAEQPSAAPQTSQAGQQNDNTADKKTPFSDGKIDITKAISGMIGDENGNVSIGKLLELLPKGSSESAALAQLERLDPDSKEYQAAMQLLGTLSYQDVYKRQVHAGAGGDRSACVSALQMCPTQIRIADILALIHI